MRTLFAHSDSPSSSKALQELLEHCRAQLGAGTPKAGLLFCGVEYDQPLILAGIQAAWPGLPIIGASSDGELSSVLGCVDDSVLLTLFEGEELTVHAGVGRDLSADIPGAVAAALANNTVTRPTLCVTTFAPTTNASEVIRELTRQLGDVGCPVVGGLSGDHREFNKTMEYFGGEALRDALPLLLIQGDFSVSWGIGSGWSPFGERHAVTRSSGHEVQEIDGRPALDFYREQYGEVPTESLGEYPLAVFAESGDSSLRAILSRDDATGALRFAGEVPEGAEVQVTQVLDEGILSGSRDALAEALDRFQGSAPEIALIFTCAARKWVLGPDADEELGVLRQLAQDRGLQELAIVGLYCFGEIAPAGATLENAFHNETCVSVVLGPK
ncbi:MAG: FIST N-terminal domain-containing protein [Planctomycetota bacterium]